MVHWTTANGEAGKAVAGDENIAVPELLEPPPAEKKSEDIFSTNLPSDEHYDGVIDSLTESELVPFFGAGVNMCGRPENVGWGPGQYLPSGAELASYLANRREMMEKLASGDKRILRVVAPPANRTTRATKSSTMSSRRRLLTGVVAIKHDTTGDDYGPG